MIYKIFSLKKNDVVVAISILIHSAKMSPRFVSRSALTKHRDKKYRNKFQRLWLMKFNSLPKLRFARHENFSFTLRPLSTFFEKGFLASSQWKNFFRFLYKCKKYFHVLDCRNYFLETTMFPYSVLPTSSCLHPKYPRSLPNCPDGFLFSKGWFFANPCKSSNNCCFCSFVSRVSPKT